MVQAPGVHVPRSEAEATRRRLEEEGSLRHDLHALETADGIAFPVTPDGEAAEETGDYDFRARARRPRSYTDLLDWDAHELAQAPRAFEHMGDIAVLKVPEPLWPRREQLGRALVAFLPSVRAVFHDHGVKGEHRTRDLERLAGDGGSATVVQENNFRLHVDVQKAYFSPRLADERARLAGLVQPRQRVIDLFGGVGPFAVQGAARGAEVVCIDINPDAAELARRNAEENRVPFEVIEGDARQVALALQPADHVVMNLPHGARDFLDVAVPLVAPGGTLHYHEILAEEDLPARREALVGEIAALGRTATVAHVRHVRNYSARESHYAIDLEVA